MIEKLTEEQKTAFSYAVRDINNGYETLWTNRLKKEYPELYEYANRKHEYNIGRGEE